MTGHRGRTGARIQKPRIGYRWHDRLITNAITARLRVRDRAVVRAARRRRRVHAPVPLVSVPIATYDRIDLVVSRTIPALLGQTHPAIEVIVVGDGTRTDLWEGAAGIIDPRVRVRRLRRRTRYPRYPLERWMVAGWRPRRVAARMAHGEWLLWMSDDDIILPDGVERLLDVVRGDPTVEAVTGAYYVGLARRVIRHPEDGASGLGFAASGMPALLVRADLRGVVWNRHSWRKTWNRPSDYDLMDRLNRAGVRWGRTSVPVAVVPEVEGTGVVGSAGSIMEDQHRRRDS